VMPEHQRVEKNENIAKTNIFNFVEFSFRHYLSNCLGLLLNTVSMCLMLHD